jgi:hypothetical protein
LPDDIFMPKGVYDKDSTIIIFPCFVGHIAAVHRRISANVPAGHS